LFWSWMIAVVVQRIRRLKRSALNPRERYLLAFVALGYLLWMELFSIYRYVVPIELLAPLSVFVLLARLLPYFTARRVAAYLLAVTTLVVVFGGVQTWGHKGWSMRAFKAELPRLDVPDQTTAVIVGGDPAFGWLATLFPPNVAFTQIEGSFPGSHLYQERVHELITRRGGSAFAVFDAHYNRREDTIMRANRIIEKAGLSSSERGCRVIQWAVSRFRMRASVQETPPDFRGLRCQLALRKDDVLDIPAENRAEIEKARTILDRAGLALDANQCSVQRAYLGDGTYPYHWCQIVIAVSAHK
jgi:hypothetical protein